MFYVKEEDHNDHDDHALVVRNLVVGHRPVYALGEWAAAYDPGVLGPKVGDACAAACGKPPTGEALARFYPWAATDADLIRGRGQPGPDP